MFSNVYNDRRVLITGHTGFKGSWLTAWLTLLNARICGISIDIPTKPSHFSLCHFDEQIAHNLLDVRVFKKVHQTIQSFQPEIIFHLAAQPIVKKSFENPAQTFSTNVMGTMNILEAVRSCPFVKAVVLITSDKCYENVEWIWGYRENDRLGGKDPYSASKACAEILARSYIESFFRDSPSRIATVRAGNVIGGGDWARDRIIPDAIRAWSNNEKVILRNPYSTRPWQHVLEPLSGYLHLGAALFKGDDRVQNQAFNFGPDARVNQSVQELIATLSKSWNGASWESVPSENMGGEAGLLKLNCDKALNLLNWHAVLDFEKTMEFTGTWYKEYYTRTGIIVRDLTQRQIQDYIELAKNQQLNWTNEH